MATPHLEPLQTRIETVIALSRLLERVEALASPQPLRDERAARSIA